MSDKLVGTEIFRFEIMEAQEIVQIDIHYTVEHKCCKEHQDIYD